MPVSITRFGQATADKPLAATPPNRHGRLKPVSSVFKSAGETGRGRSVTSRCPFFDVTNRWMVGGYLVGSEEKSLLL